MSKKHPPLIDAQLRRAISDSGLSQYRIATDAGISPIQIKRFLSGERDLRLASAAKIAHVLGLELRPISHPKGKP